MAKDKVTSNGEKNQTVSNVFERITDVIGSLKFLYQINRTDGAFEGLAAYPIANQHVLAFEIESLDEALSELAAEFDGLTYREIKLGD